MLGCRFRPHDDMDENHQFNHCHPCLIGLLALGLMNQSLPGFAPSSLMSGGNGRKAITPETRELPALERLQQVLLPTPDWRVGGCINSKETASCTNDILSNRPPVLARLTIQCHQLIPTMHQGNTRRSRLSLFEKLTVYFWASSDGRVLQRMERLGYR